MNDKVTVIDIVAQVTDQTGDGAASATENVSKLEQAMKKAQGELSKMLKMGKLELTMYVIDKASKGIESIMQRGRQIAGKAWTVTIGIIDRVTAPIRGMISQLGTLLGITGLVSAALGGLTIHSALQAAASGQRAKTQLSTVLRNTNPEEAPTRGRRGESVRYLQSRLNELNNAGLEVDGRHGPRTAKALAEYQAKSGDGLDKIMTGHTQTWERNLEDLQKYASELQKKTMYDDTSYTAAAAEFATYLSDPKAIKMMMSTLGDYAAGMSGGAELNESQMVDYATQLGKALNAEDATFDGLKKKGFTVSEEQEEILKSANTSDLKRAAVLSQIIAESWKGMAENMAKTAPGRMAQMTNSWGNILQEIGKTIDPSVAKFVEMLHSKLPAIGDLLKRGAEGLGGIIESMVSAVSSGIDSAISGIEKFADKMSAITNSAEFQNADFFGKSKIMWDEIIAKPFNDWWGGSGRAWIASKMEDIGSVMSSALGKIMKALWEQVKSFASAHPILTTLYAGAKGLPIVNNMLKAGASIYRVGSALYQGGSAFYGGVKAYGAANARGAGSAAQSALTFARSGQMGTGAQMGAGAASMAAPVATAVGAVLGAAGLVSAARDLSEAVTTLNEKEKRDSYFKAGTKAGMVGLGAGIGTLIAPGVGTAIGAGIGGLGALMFGGAAGKGLSDMMDGTARIRDTTENLKNATSAFQEAVAKDIGIQGLLEQYQELEKAINGGKLGTDGIAEAQEKMKDIVEALAQAYPNLITQYEKENGVLANKLGLLKNLSETERAQKKAELGKQVFEAQTKLADAGERYAKSQGEYAKHKEQAGFYGDAVTYIQDRTKQIGAWESELKNPQLTADRRKGLEDQINAGYSVTERYLKARGLDYSFRESGDYGSNPRLGRFDTDPAKLMQNAINDLYKLRESAFGGMQTEEKTQLELINAMNAAYEAQKQLIEEELAPTLGGTLEEGAKKFDALGEAGQSAFRKAIEELDQFANKLTLLPSNFSADMERWSKTAPIEQHAEGGIMTNPHFGLVAEDGAEAIIPLSAGRRGRGLSLWERAGEMLGVKPYAEGGIVGATPTASASAGGAAISVPVNIGEVKFEVNIDGKDVDENRIIQVMGENIKNFTDEIAHRIAVAIQQSYANMPREAEGAY